MLDNREEYRPRPTLDVIVADMPFKEHMSYDYWSLRRNGDFLLLQSLFEDKRNPSFTALYFNTRTLRRREALLYCACSIHDSAF